MVPTIPQFLHNLLGMRRTLSVRQAFLKVGRFAVWLAQLGGLEDAPALQALDVGSGIVLGDYPSLAMLAIIRHNHCFWDTKSAGQPGRRISKLQTQLEAGFPNGPMPLLQWQELA
jgi:hypothetical protein